MKNNERKFFIPVNGTLFEVSEDVYRTYYRPIWNTRSRAQNNGECHITKSRMWMCDGICPGCPFQTCGRNISLETPIGDGDITVGDTLQDDSPTPESILMDRELISALYRELDLLDPEGKRICELVASNYSEREAAAIMGIPKSTFRYKWLKIRNRLAEELKDYI